MAAKKKSKKKVKSTSRKKALPLKTRNKANRKKGKKKAAASQRSTARQVASRAGKPKKRARAKIWQQESAYPHPSQAPADNQSGDLQGLSTAAVLDSESIDELAEEGNAFEADVLQGVEDAENDGEREVRTHEVPEDDVPREYLDEE
jgi:hypothetical protein